jgi:hypothetical protein
MRRVFGLFLYHPEKRVSPAKACTCTGFSNAGVLFFIDARPYRCGKCRLRFYGPKKSSTDTISCRKAESRRPD